MTRESLDPLPYRHKRGRHAVLGHMWACTRPETTELNIAYAIKHCPGCRALAMARAIERPSRKARLMDSGKYVLMVDRIRQVTPPDDPMLVLFERALAVREAESYLSNEEESE